MKLCAAHSMPYCRICNKVAKPKFGERPKPLRKSQRSRDHYMSENARVQESFGGRCILLGFMAGDCGERVQRCHIVKQEYIRDTYPHGAWRYIGDEFWRPTTRETDLDIEGIEHIKCRSILEDDRNLVPGCEVHNVDGLQMIDALDRRKVAGLMSYPAGFGAFTHEFRFSIDGSTHWFYVPFEVELERKVFGA